MNNKFLLSKRKNSQIILILQAFLQKNQKIFESRIILVSHFPNFSAVKKYGNYRFAQ